MKKYESFKSWVADQSPKHKRLILTLRKLVKQISPQLTESVKWGNGCWIDKKDKPVIYLHAEEDHLQFGFFNGIELKDPKKLLIGNGKFVRHVKIKVAKDIDVMALTQFIKKSKSV